MKGVKAGDKLKVKESRTVWHSPKHKVVTCYALKHGARTPKNGYFSPVNFGCALSRLSRAKTRCLLQEGLDLKGMEGTILDVIEKYQGKQLSANLPYKTQFLIPNEDTGKEQKLICHLVRTLAYGAAELYTCSAYTLV